MDSKKVFFIILVVIAVLYFATLGTGIWLNQGEEPKNPSEATDQWVGSLKSFTSLFAPALDLTGLKCNGQAVAGVFQLKVKGHTEKGCEIGIPADDDEDYRKTELSTVGSPAGIYVRARFDSEKFKKADKADNCYLDSQKLPDGLRLEVEYEPNESSDGDMWECLILQEPDEPVTITALSEGGTLRLTLRCDDCKDGPGCEQPCKDTTHVVRLRMK